MPRGKIWGYLSLIVVLLLGGLFSYSAFILSNDYSFETLYPFSYFTIAVPIGLVSYALLGTGLWIGLTILTIKVVPPMPEIVEKKDFSKIQAFLLCVISLALAVLLGYGIYIKSYWALAIPAAVISLVILGSVFWVGVAIITTRTTLPDNK
ncbi:MAG: hypothetical protein CVV44_00765 [Spirochaetae bacterium HGW-Spirochaetae-1]|jgi:uncharacterized protein with PQ loop repeat|nr:MAG: hypothetical protein CVV44_00765 [Spirochaetae bacterium HGW-Spirochaetae-1]